MCDAWLRLSLLVIILIVLEGHCKHIKKVNKNDERSIKEPTRAKSTTKPKSSKLTPPPILAIEIVDSEDDNTKSKNSKRTIDSSLGYGHQQNYFGVTNRPKFQIYKYSQEDIPPQRRPSFSRNNAYDQPQIQKSIGYDLGTQTQVLYNKQTNYVNNAPQQSLAPYYQPGTRLFTTVDQHGQVGELSQQVPGYTSSQQSPVVYLRIFKNQLTNPNDLYPNLPESHPYSNINSINLQSLLTSYLQNNPNDYRYIQQLSHGEPSYNQGHDYQTYQNQAHQYQYEQPQQILKSNQEDASVEKLPTHENYPDDSHTRVIFYSNNNGHLPEKDDAKHLNIPVSSSYVSQQGDNQPQSHSAYTNLPLQYPETSQQVQDEQGYYYYNPNQPAHSQNVQNYQVQDTGLYYKTNTFDEITPNTIIDKQNDDNAPYNYHARARKRDVVNRPISEVEKRTI